MSQQTVLTLIAPQAEEIAGELLTQAQRLLQQAGAGEVRIEALTDGRQAYDIICDGLPPEQADTALRDLLTNKKTDAVAQRFPRRDYKLLICDMDSTIIEQECIDELADMIGRKEEVAAITARAMNGELDFAAALRERVKLLAGLDVTVLEDVFARRITLTAGAKELVAGMRKRGALTVLVSGGFTFFTEKVAAAAGFDEHYGNELIAENGKLSGEVREPILGAEAKLARLREVCARLNISPAEALAVGDGANDLPMLLAAGMGIAYRAKPTVQKSARSRINTCDLSALLYVAGLTYVNRK